MFTKFSLLWKVTHRRLTFFDVSGQTPATACPLKICITETSVNIYISTQRNIPEEGRSDLQLGRSMKSFIMQRNHNRYLIQC